MYCYVLYLCLLIYFCDFKAICFYFRSCDKIRISGMIKQFDQNIPGNSEQLVDNDQTSSFTFLCYVVCICIIHSLVTNSLRNGSMNSFVFHSNRQKKKCLSILIIMERTFLLLSNSQIKMVLKNEVNK